MQARNQGSNARRYSRSRLKRNLLLALGVVLLLVFAAQQFSSLQGYRLLVWEHRIPENQPTYLITNADNTVSYVFPGALACNYLGGFKLSETPAPDEKVRGVFYGVWVGECPMLMPPDAILDANRDRRRL